MAEPSGKPVRAKLLIAPQVQNRRLCLWAQPIWASQWMTGPVDEAGLSFNLVAV